MIYACRLTSQQTLHTSVEVHSGRFYRTVARPLTKVQARPRPLSPSRGFPRFTSSKLTVTSFASFLGFVFLSAQQVFPASQCSQGSNGLKTTKKKHDKVHSRVHFRSSARVCQCGGTFKGKRVVFASVQPPHARSH